eukprot:scaffold141807_cov32-Tisochrysis_lutea.AAC.7
MRGLGLHASLLGSCLPPSGCCGSISSGHLVPLPPSLDGRGVQDAILERVEVLPHVCNDLRLSFDTVDAHARHTLTQLLDGPPLPFGLVHRLPLRLLVRHRLLVRLLRLTIA